MGSFIDEDLSIIVNESDDFSSFEIEESVIGDPEFHNESTKSSVVKNLTNRGNSPTSEDTKNHKSTFKHRSSTRPVNVSFSTTTYRSSVKDSSKNSTTESDAIVLSSDDDEDDSQSESNSLRSEAATSNNNLESTGSSTDETSMFKEVTKAVYDAHAAKVGEISERIQQYESLLKLSSQLPDKGAKLKQLVAKLKSDLSDQKNTLQNLSIKEPDLALDFQNLSINESDKEKELERTGELSYDDCDSLKSLFDEMKRSEKSMPNKEDLADQPRLINGNLMPHQRKALAWMNWRESQYPQGGILGDDMGLGKTLTIISLIARHIEMSESKSQEKKNAKQKQDASDWKGRTLVVCPASVIRQWEDEINKFTNFAISVCLHHGDKRSVSAKELCSHDVVITTYGIVRSEIEKNSTLAQIHWERIVLDEAHTIRNYTSKQSLSCCRLKGTKKWALTGTPIQNKHGDVFALIKFLQCEPLNDFKMWKHMTSKQPEQRISYLLKFFLLRRTKDELGKIGEISSLPQKTLRTIQIPLSADELKVYETVSSFSKILSEKFRHQRDPNHNFRRSKNDQMQQALDFFTISGSVSTSHILLVILRLRQICIHPNLIDAMLMEEDIRDISGESNLLEELNELTIGGKNGDQKLLRSNSVFDAQRPSSKFESILHIIQTKVIEGQEKAVVVSQFTSVLKLFEYHLATHQIKYLVLTGSTKISHRQNIVQSFNNDPDEQILLLSLTAGGVGLNLCGANNLFFIDPHWNPQLESQAEDRIYRIGQTKLVTIYRFICEGTIEERIQKLQERKKGVAKNILSGYKLNIDDMMALI